jgi:uncharacterized protein (TIRG00374 family)
MIAGLIVFILYLYFFVGIPQILQVLSKVNSAQYALFYTLSILAVLGSVFFWSAAWNSILKNLSVKISYRRAYLYYWVGYFTDLVIPCMTVCGELTRLYLVQKETHQNYGALAASAVTNRIVAYVIVTAGLYAGAVFIFLKPGTPQIITNLFLLFLIGATFYLAILLFLAFFEGSAKTLSKIYLTIYKTLRPKKYKPSDIEKTENSLANFYSGFKIFREKPKYLIRPFIFHFTSYMLGILVYVLIFFALGIQSNSPEFYIVIYFIATAVQDVSASFSVGSLDIFLATIFIFFGLGTGTSGIAAAVLRSASFWFPLFAGFVCLQIVGAKNLLSPKHEAIEGHLTDGKLLQPTIKPQIEQ